MAGREYVTDLDPDEARAGDNDPVEWRIRATLGVPRLFWISGSKMVGLVDDTSPYQGGVDAELDRLGQYERRLIEAALLHALDEVRKHIAGAS